MPHILIVEDDRAIARIEKDYLELNGFQVTLAEDGETGRKLALQQPFDLLLLDVMLPKMAGFTLLQHLREQLCSSLKSVKCRTIHADELHRLENVENQRALSLA